MPPIAIDVEAVPARTTSQSNGVQESKVSKNSSTAPLIYSGSLDEYESFQVTNVIGKEFPKLQLSEIVNNDDKVRDLAILGVYVCFS
jgi:hypothetical protein